MKTRILLTFLSVVLFVSCNRKPAPAGQAESAGETAAGGKFGIKSGIVEYKTNMMGFEASQILYFDDHGAREANEIVMEMMGTKMRTHTITKDGYTYNFDPEKKTGSKMALSSGPGQINFNDLSEEIVKEWNLKEEGKETFLDKECLKYSAEHKAMNMKGSYWVWKGIALKMEMDMATSKMVMEAVSLMENVEIPAGKFEVPADIQFQ